MAIRRWITSAFAPISYRCCGKLLPTSFSRRAGTSKDRYERFCRDNKWWLDDYVLFSTLREQFGSSPGMRGRKTSPVVIQDAGKTADAAEK